MNTAEQYRRWFEYEIDAHAKMLASLEAVPDAVRRAPQVQKAVDLAAHLVAARRLWLGRLGLTPDRPKELFPAGVRLADLRADFDRMHADWRTYLAGLDAAEAGRVFEYRSWEGDPYRNRVEDILAQLFGHSWYHRGQIALLLRQAGAEPAATDFVFWTREPIHPHT
jgi:uncharacterized damage-inducible protein DinB